MLVFEHTAHDFFNDNVKITLDYEEADMYYVKPSNDPNWQLKLTYNGYPDIQLPNIIWNQTSNPLGQNNVQGFNIVENNLKR